MKTASGQHLPASDKSGIRFTPPHATVDPMATTGEAMVEWKKIGDLYVLTRFDGEQITDEGMKADGKTNSRDMWEQEIERIAR